MAELDLTNIAATSIATPAAGVTAVYVDSTSKTLKTKNDAGFVTGITLSNFSVAAQTPAAATRTYITGSALTIPTNKMQIGTIFRWRFNMTKTAAGVAASTFDVAIGTLGTTGDAAILSFTKPAGTNVVDEAWCEIEVIVRGPLSASGILSGQFTMIHNLAATGHAQIPAVVVNTVSGAFNVTTAGLIVGVCITSGAADAITIQQITADAVNI